MRRHRTTGNEPSRNRFRTVLKVGAATCTTVVLSAVVGYTVLKLRVPSIRSLNDYNPPRCTKVYSDDGHLVGEFFKERRTVVPTDAIPQHVVHAFLAAEDAGFYQHEGLDYLGILRAAIKNLRPGAHLQGASTITQQIVKTMIVGPQRSYARKMREAILARELEQMLTKDEILHLYLNQIYFGGGAHGIEEACRLYFGKTVREVNLSEAAYLASIPKNPSRYTIRENPTAAKERQSYVLNQMVNKGWASPEMVQTIREEAVPKPAPRPPYLGRVPHYVEHVRRLLIEQYGEDDVYHKGFTVYTGMHAEMQAAAQDAVRKGLEDLGRRHGYPGAAVRIEVDRLERYRAVMHDELQRMLTRQASYGAPEPAPSVGSMPSTWDLRLVKNQHLVDEASLRRAVVLTEAEAYKQITGLVSHVDSVQNIAWIDLGTMYGRLSLESLHWARPFDPYSKTRRPRDPSEVLQKGDLAPVEIVGDIVGKRDDKPIVPVELIPRPMAEGALVAVDPHTRYVRAIVGGYEQIAGGLIRATQSRRQPGSAFKPILYATALAQQAITAADMCPDAPVIIRDPWTGKAWKPQNYDGRYAGNITYRKALTRSKNTCSVKLIDKIGYEPVVETARKLGISSSLPENLTLALGTCDVLPLELANAYATLASNGLHAEPIFVRKVVDATSQILVERRADAEQVLDPAASFVTTYMMQGVIEEGTATRAKLLDRPLAGKTGTTNEARNAWFAGFSPGLVATVWVGFDDNKPLGAVSGGSVALPIWIRFMGRALAGVEPQPFALPEGVVMRHVHRTTGMPVKDPEDPQSIEEAFIAGTEPEERTQPLPSPFLVEDGAQAPF